MNRVGRFLLLIGLLAAGLVTARPPDILPSGKLQLQIKKLGVLGSVLYIAAHPDDENTALLAYLANERLVRTAYLSITRGDGGQNLLGPEKGEALGIIRTQELLAARRIDGAQQFFTRAIDFGYSKTPEEALRIWNHDQILSDVVWVIRKFRPDVIITRFTPQKGGHGHHRASAILAEEAFQAAGDPTRFPEQLQYVHTWQPKRMFWNAWRVDPETRSPDLPKLVKVDLGIYNPLLGKSYPEIAALSRSMHKSQGFGAAARRGEYPNYFELTAGEPAEADLLEGIELSWKRVAGSEKIETLLLQTSRDFQPQAPWKSLPRLLQTYQEISSLKSSFWKEVKLRELKDVIRSCAGLWLQATVSQPVAVPGQRVGLHLEIINRSAYPIRLKGIRVFPTETSLAAAQSLPESHPVEVDTSLVVPPDAELSGPYWLRERHAKGRYRVSDPLLVGLPETPPVFQVEFQLDFEGTILNYRLPIEYRWTDPVAGEQYRPFVVAPALTFNFLDRVRLFADDSSRQVAGLVTVRPTSEQQALHFEAPAGWMATPLILRPPRSADKTVIPVQIELSPPANSSQDTLTVWMQDVSNKPVYSEVEIHYPHIPVQTYFPPALLKLVRLNIRTFPDRIGYIMGSGDDIPTYLEQLGYRVQMLGDEQLTANELERFDVIITGVRAYNTRTALKAVQPQLLEFVEKGGTMIVQYNTSRSLLVEQPGPYPFRISRERVTVEEAPVTFLDPNHPLLSFPNRLEQKDFEGWVQERGLYFCDQWDEHYQTVLASNDPGEQPLEGGLLFARYGKGIFIYTGFSFFRQLPAGVPGAFRLFVNLISAGHYHGQ